VAKNISELALYTRLKMHAKIGVEVMEKMEYKTVTINASGGAIKFSAEKFDSDCTEQINKTTNELNVDGLGAVKCFLCCINRDIYFGFQV